MDRRRISAYALSGALLVALVLAVLFRDDAPWHTRNTSAIEIAPCLIADRVEPAADGIGRLVLRVPGVGTIEGAYTAVDEDNWTFRPDTVDALVGSTDVADDEVTGTIQAADGAITSDVEIEMSDHPTLVDGWDHAAILSLPYDHTTCPDAVEPAAAGLPLVLGGRPAQNSTDSVQGLAGGIDITVDNEHGNLHLTGKLNRDGSYELTVTGTVRIEGRNIPVNGTYTASKNGDEWEIDGDLAGVQLGGVTVVDGAISLRPGTPGFFGSATLQIDDGPTITTALDYEDDDDWTLTATGDEGTWTPTETPGVEIDAGTFTGTITSTDGEVDWNFSAAATADLSGATLELGVELTGPDSLTLTATGASGTLTAPSGSLATVDASGTVSVDDGSVDGEIDIEISASELAFLNGWDLDGQLELTFASSPPTAELDLALDATSGADAISLSGDWAAASYTLTADGELSVGDGTARVSGSYSSSSAGVDWALDASVNNVTLAADLGIESASFSATSDQPGFTGAATLDIGGGSVGAEVDWTDADDWTLDLTTSGGSWRPDAYSGIALDSGSLTGSITSTGGAVDWSVGASDVTFALTSGVDVTSDITLSNTCTGSPYCPSTPGVYLGMDGAITSVDDGGVPDVIATGALAVNGSWGRLDATTGRVTFAGMRVDEPTLTIWRGPRSDQPVAGLGMPDLSADTDGFGIEFCGAFTVPIPDITTIGSDGCIGWTPNGIVMGQLTESDDVDSGSTNGLTLGPVSLDGWALSTLSTGSEPIITLDDVRLSLPSGVDQITGTITAPGNLMSAISGSSDASEITATGWFDGGDFELSGRIQVGGADGVTAQGVTLQALTIDIGKDGSDFGFEIGADGLIEIHDTRFPLTAAVGVTAGTSNSVYVNVGATGVSTQLTSGSFDDPTLLPAGDFEPDNDSSIPGDFDTGLPAQLISDGGFEAGRSDPSSLPNGDFEEGAGDSIVLGGDFEDGDWLNLLDNPGFEDGVNRAPDGDFEGLTAMPDQWSTTSGAYSISLVGDAVDGLDDPGITALQITSRTSSTNAGEGALLDGIGGVQSGAPYYRITFDVRSTGNGGKIVSRFRERKDCNDLNTDHTTTLSGQNWTTVSFTASTRGCKEIKLSINPPANSTIHVDNVEIIPVASTSSNSEVGNQSYPPNAESSFYTQPSSTRLDTNIPISTNLAPFGDAYYSTKKKDNNARYWSQLGEAPCPSPCEGATYSWSVWLKSSKNIGGSLRLFAPGANGAPDTYVDVPWTASSTWTRHTVMMTVTDSRYEDLYAMAYVGSKDAWVDFDEMTFQKIPWRPYDASNSTHIARVADNGDSTAHWGTGSNDKVDAADGTSFMVIGDNGAGGFVRQYLDVEPVVGATYTFSADVRNFGTTGASSYLQMVTRGDSGGPDVQDRRTTFTPTNEWKRVSLSVTITDSADSIQLRINAGHTLAIDNVTFTGTPLVINQPSDATWTIRDGHFATSATYDDPDGAYEGDAYLLLNSSSPGSTAQVNSGVTPTTGSVHQLSGWIKSTTSATIELLAGSSSSSEKTRVTAGGSGSWEQFSVDLEINGSNPGPFYILATPTATGVDVRLDDLQITQVGLTPADPWFTEYGNTFAIIDEDGVSRTGDGALAVSTNGTGGQAVLEVDLGAAGDTTPLSVGMWVKSGDGSPVTGFAAVMDAATNGQGADISAGDDWSFVGLTFMPLATSASATVVINLAEPGRTLLVDDLTVSRLNDWTPGNAMTSAVVITDDGAHDGTGYLNVAAVASDRASITATSTETPLASSDYTAGMWVRSTDGGTGTITIDPSSGSSVATSFSATNDWTWVEVTRPATSSTPASLDVTISVDTPGTSLDIDTVTLQGTLFTPSDPWTIEPNSGGAVIALHRRDDVDAQSGDGFLDLAHHGGGVTLSHTIDNTPTAGEVYTMTAWVKSVDDTSANGSIKLSTRGGTVTSNTESFSVGADWEQVTLSLTVGAGSHSGLLAELVLADSSGEVDIDSIVVQQAQWDPVGGASTEQRNDTTLADSGTGYLLITGSATASVNSSSGAQVTGPWVSDSSDSDDGASRVAIVYVRADDDTTVDGRLVLTLSGSAGTDEMVMPFTADDVWDEVALELPLNHSSYDTITTAVYVDDPSGRVWLDSVSVRPGPLDADPDANATLDHPDWGYTYLWDDAFGIPGAHLWSINAEVSVTDGSPGLGVASTVYLDPSRMSALTGTDWIRGDLVANISYTEPCFAFGFEGSNGSGVSVADGVFTATEFQVAIAPRGCSVGNVTLPEGASLSFDASIGTAEFRLDMAIGVDSDNLPYFSYDAELSDLVIAGTTYDDMRLTVYQSTSRSEASFSGGFTLPIGQANADLDLSASATGVKMQGDVSLLDWTIASDAFTVDELSFYWNIDVPIGGSCAPTVESSATGDLSLGGNSLAFSGKIAFDCGELQTFAVNVTVDRSTGATYTLALSYDNATHIFSGDLEWKFKRKNSFKVAGIKIARRAKVSVGMSLWVDFDKPSSAKFTFAGSISVPSGGGSVDCKLSGSSMGCDVEFYVNLAGKHYYSGSW